MAFQIDNVRCNSPNNSAFENEHLFRAKRNPHNRGRAGERQRTCWITQKHMSSLWHHITVLILCLPCTTVKFSVALSLQTLLLTHSLIAILLNNLPPSVAPRKCYLWNHFKGKFPSDFTLHRACKAARREFKSSALFSPKPMNMFWIQLISGIKASF